MQRLGIAPTLLAAMAFGPAAEAQMDNQTEPRTESEGQTMLVLDGSGSMWGRIDGQPKITIARDSVDRMLAQWPTGRDLGLIAYGHRREGDCGDIETLISPSALDRQAFIDRAESVSPRGKTPIGAAVEAAADEMAGSAVPSSVIVVTDGLETCGADLCALGDRLAQSGMGLTAHVIGFDVTDTEGQLACLAETTGGQYFQASNADSLIGALTEVSAPESEPEPEPNPEPAGPLFVDEFERSELGEDWSVEHPDPSGFIVDEGALVTMTVQSGHLGTAEQPNVFRWTGAELPDGDWEIDAAFTARMGEVQTLGGRRAIVQVGRYADSDNYIAVEVYRQGNSNDDMWLKLLAVAGGNKTVADVEIAGDTRGYDLARILRDFEDKGASLVLSKTGRDYVGRLEMNGWAMQEGGPDVIETDPVQVLSSSGDPALFAGTIGSEQTVVEFGRVEIRGEE